MVDIAQTANCAYTSAMPRGRQSKVLTPVQIRRLERFRIHERYSLPELQRAIAAPFAWETLQRAMQGKPIWELNHLYLVQWIERYLKDGRK